MIASHRVTPRPAGSQLREANEVSAPVPARIQIVVGRKPKAA
jgi:hypothetical protein